MDRFSDEELLSSLLELNPYEFESFIAALWQLQGWETEVTHGSGDKGIDVIATQSFPIETTAHLQAKRYNPDNQVSGPEMQKYVSLTQRPGVDLTIVVTTSSFTNQAMSLAGEFNIKIIDGKKLVNLIRELEAKELLSEYINAEKIPESPSIKTPATSTKSSETLQPSSTAVSGDWLRLEIVGAGRISGNIGGSTGGGVDGLALSFEIANLCDDHWEFRANNKDNDLGFSALDASGFAYMPSWIPDPFLRGENLGNGWIWDTTTIRSNSRARLAAYWDIPDDVEILSIEYEEEVRRATDNEKYAYGEEMERLQIRLPGPARSATDELPKEILDTIE